MSVLALWSFWSKGSILRVHAPFLLELALLLEGGRGAYFVSFILVLRDKSKDERLIEKLQQVKLKNLKL